MDNAMERAKAIAEAAQRVKQALANFETRSRRFTVGIDFAGSKTVTVEAETAAEAELKAKKIARDMFEQDCLVKAQE